MAKKNDTKMRILHYIAEYQTEHDYPPSIRQIAAAVHLKSTGSVSRHLTDLVNMGLLHQEEASRPRTVNKESTMPMEYVCLKTDDGGSIILGCTESGGKMMFSGVFCILGVKSTTGNIIACRDMSENELMAALA